MLSLNTYPNQYIYRRLTDQPLDIRYEYVEPLKPRTKNQTKGHVQFFVQVAERQYGPFMTVYRIAPALWEARKQKTTSLEAKRINTRLLDFSIRLINAWKAHAGTSEPITADMLFKRGTFTVIQLVEGGTVYVL